MPSTPVATAEPATAGAQTSVGAWNNPPAVAPRGTLLLVAGRGEHPGVYERFGTRIAVDGYRVRVIGDPTDDADAVSANLRDLLSDPELPTPRVLAGSDAGASFAAALVATGKVQVDGLILVGLPTATATDGTATDGTATDGGATDGRATDGDAWRAELAERTACPTHQARLDADPRLRRGVLDTAVPAQWSADADLSKVDVPVLGLHGAADTVSRLAAAKESYAAASAGELVVIAGGRHDALNDATHRTAAAVVVLFLERLRVGADAPAIASWARTS